MSFRFALEGLLRVRLSRERQRELALQQAHQRVNEVRHKIESVDERVAALNECEQRELCGGLRASELKFYGLCRSVLGQYRQELEAEMARRQEELRISSALLTQARTEREAVETVRRHQLAAYRLNEARKDQRALDDLFLMRKFNS
jgi:flagellar export protein FliJ